MFLGLVLTSFVVWHKDRSFARAGTAPSVLIPNITTLQLPSMPPLSLQEGSGQGHCVRRHRDPPQEHWRIGAHVPHGDRDHPGRGRLRRPEDDPCQQDGPPLISKNGSTRPFFDRLSFQKEMTFCTYILISYIALRERECIGVQQRAYFCRCYKSTVRGTVDHRQTFSIHRTAHRPHSFPRAKERANFST